MRCIFCFLKCRATGYYNKITTGKCGLHLYYNGCGCEDCNNQQQIECDNIGIKNKYGSKN